MKEKFLLIFVISICLIFIHCAPPQESEPDVAAIEASKADFVKTMQKHLDAVTNRDLATLESTLSTNGKLHLILPGTEVSETVDGFVDYHREWFKDTTAVWGFKTKILDTVIADNMGIAITEIVYSEPERDGKPYWNRMNVSYALEKQSGQWKIIKDHASSIEKSTDNK